MKQGLNILAAEKLCLFQRYAFACMVPQECLLTLGNVTSLLKLVCACLDLTSKDPVLVKHAPTSDFLVLDIPVEQQNLL